MKLRIETLGPVRSIPGEGHHLYLEAYVTSPTLETLDRIRTEMDIHRLDCDELELLLPPVVPPPPPTRDPLWDEIAVKECSHRDAIRGRMVVIESPFMGGAAIAQLYARLAMREQLLLGATPFASHLLYPQALDDADPQQRRQGIRCGWAPYAVGARAEVYTDLGISIGMAEGIEEARRLGCTITYRAFGAELRDEVLRKAHASTSPGFLDGKDARSSVVVWPA